MTDYPNNISAKLEIIKASEITPKEVRWLWYPYIPFGKVTLLQGDPGDGKSKLMLSLAALLSKGAQLPFADEDESGESMTVIYQTTEDDADDTVVPRFNSAGGDGDRLIFIKEDEKSLTFGDDRIREAVEKYHAKLLILDPMSSYTTRDQRMMCATVTIAHMADSKEQLDSDTETILSTARRHLCQLAVLKFQQTDGLNTVLPIGCKKIQATRTLTTESLAVFMPFKVQEVAHEHGIYYGQNAISNNMIIANRKCLLNGNSFILGVSGSGKSFTGKCEIANLMLAGDSDIIIIDPEREYAPLVKAMCEQNKEQNTLFW